MRRALVFIVTTGLLGVALMTILGLLAGWLPFLELINDFRPFWLAGTVALLGVALFIGRRPIIVFGAVVALTNLALFAMALPGGAASAATGTPRFLRVVSLNLWINNSHMDLVADFLRKADGDIVVLVEIEPESKAQLLKLLGSAYPYVIDSHGGILLLSKLPPIESGRQNGAKIDGWARTPLLLWAKFERDGISFELAGVHPAWPFNPLEQVADTNSLIAFAQDQSMPLVMAGDFNLTPWSLKLQRFNQETGLKRFITFAPTWPTNRLTPFVDIDNVFASQEFTVLSATVGPYVGSDHMPVIADVALAP